MAEENLSSEEITVLTGVCSEEESLPLALGILSTVCEGIDSLLPDVSIEESAEREDHPPSVLKSEMIYPVIRLFDASMFMLNYNRFYL